MSHIEMFSSDQPAVPYEESLDNTVRIGVFFFHRDSQDIPVFPGVAGHLLLLRCLPDARDQVAQAHGLFKVELFGSLFHPFRKILQDDLEPFLDALKIFDMEAQTDDRTDLHVAMWSVDAPLVGLRIQSRLCGYLPLLDGGRTANLKFEQTGIRFSGPAVHKINWTENPENVAEVARRILYIQSLGGILKYSDVADKIFKSNLLVLDTNLPRILATMLMTLHLDGTARIDELTEVLEEKNPLKVKDELVKKHGIYRYKIRQLLLAAAWGMRPAKVFDGRAGAIGGYLMVDPSGKMLLYTRAEEQAFADYLFTHTRLEKSLPDDSKYGYLERENGVYYLKLNLKIGFTKR